MEEEDVQEALSFVNDINAGCYGCGCATIIFIVAIGSAAMCRTGRYSCSFLAGLPGMAYNRCSGYVRSHSREFDQSEAAEPFRLI